jgi:hypothetical protein
MTTSRLYEHKSTWVMPWLFASPSSATFERAAAGSLTEEDCDSARSYAFTHPTQPRSSWRKLSRSRRRCFRERACSWTLVLWRLFACPCTS